MALLPFERAQRQANSKPETSSNLVIDRSTTLGGALQTLLLFDGAIKTDVALRNRQVAKRGAVTAFLGPRGAQVVSTLTGTSGPASSPCYLLNPKGTVTSTPSLSALVKFDGTLPVAGPFGQVASALAADDTGSMPIYIPVSSGNFRARTPTTEVQFTSGGASLSVGALTGWHRITVTVSGSTTTLYVDGGSTWVGTASQAFSSFLLRSVLGSDVMNGTAWPWPIVDLFYWRRTLTPEEVAAHARRPYGMLHNQLTERWLSPVAIPPTADQGDPWDFPFSDDFGAAVAFGTVAQMRGAGRVIARANVGISQPPIPVGAPALTGFGFLQAVGTATKPVTASLAGAGSLFGLGLSTAPHADLNGIGRLTANQQFIARATAGRLDGAGSLLALPGVRYSARAAQQGVGSITTDEFILEPFNHGRFRGAGVGTIRATPLRLLQSATLAVLPGNGTLSVAPGLIQRAAARANLHGYGRIITKPVVVKARRTRPGVGSDMAPQILAMELETFVPSTFAINSSLGHGVNAHGHLSRQTAPVIEQTAFLYASDVGYRTSPFDGDITVYPPLLNEAFQLDVGLALEPTRTSASAAWGSITLANPDHTFDRTITNGQNSDGRAIRLLTGIKGWDASRQYLTDPPYSTLGTLFSGIATPWVLNDDGLQVPLRDATYHLERPLQASDIYGGGGHFDGTPDLAGKPKPMTRGGSGTVPVQNVTPVLVDPLALIYQYSNAPGGIVQVYEAGAAVFTYQGDTNNLYQGTTAPGSFRQDGSRAMFQLGSLPVGQITIDCAGLFPTSGMVVHPFLICLKMLVDDMALPSSLIDDQSFTSAAASFPDYIAGIYYSSDQVLSCIDAIDAILSGTGANIVPTLDGRLRLVVLRAASSTDPVAAYFDEHDIISITRRPLPTSLDPPPFRFRVGYNHNYTVMSAALNTASSTPDRQQFVQSPDRYGVWSDQSLLRAYRRPNDFPAMPSPLLGQSFATEAANSLGALWGTKRMLFDVTLPRQRWGIEIGEVVHITYPLDQLDGYGKFAVVIGFSYRAADSSIVYTVLI